MGAEDALDRAELGQVAHAKKLKINATKSMLGHTCWAAPVVETVASVLQMNAGRLHPSINIDELDPAVDLDVCARGPAGVAEHGLGRVDLELLRVGAEDALDRAELGQVAHGSRGRVGVQVVDARRLDAALLEEPRHDARLPLLRGLRQVVAVGAGLDAQDLGVDACAAGAGRVHVLEDEGGPTVRGHEPLPPHVERAARSGRLVVPALERDRAHERHGVELDRRVVEHGSDDEGGLLTVVADLVDGAPQRRVRARAGGADGVDRAENGQDLRDAARVVGIETVEREEAVYEVGLLLEADPVLVLVVEVEVVPGDDSGDARRVGRVSEEPGVPVGVDRDEDRELRRPGDGPAELAQSRVHVLGHDAPERGDLAGYVVLREVGADLGVDARGIERLPARDRGAPREEALEEAVQGVAERRVDRHPRDRDAPLSRQSTPP